MKNKSEVLAALDALAQSFNQAAAAVKPKSAWSRVFSIGNQVEAIVLEDVVRDVQALRDSLETHDVDEGNLSQSLKALKNRFDSYAATKRGQARNDRFSRKYYLKRATKAEGYARQVSEAAVKLGVMI